MRTSITLVPLIGVLAIAAFAPSAVAADPFPTPQDLAVFPELRVTYLLPPPMTSPTRDLRPVPNPATGRYFELVYVFGQPHVKVRIRNIGVLPAGPSVTRVVFQRNAPLGNAVAHLPCPALGAGMTFIHLVPVPPASFNPVLDYGVRADVFNAVPESNEWNNAVVVHPWN